MITELLNSLPYSQSEAEQYPVNLEILYESYLISLRDDFNELAKGLNVDTINESKFFMPLFFAAKLINWATKNTAFEDLYKLTSKLQLNEKLLVLFLILNGDFYWLFRGTMNKSMNWLLILTSPGHQLKSVIELYLRALNGDTHDTLDDVLMASIEICITFLRATSERLAQINQD